MSERDLDGANGAPSALQFDLNARTLVMTEAGSFPSLHPVDQGVALALGIRRGEIASAPKLGHRFAELARAAPRTLPRHAEDLVRATLACWLDRGDIVLVRVETETRVRGRLDIRVTYRNRRLEGAPLRRLRASGDSPP